ncbi:MAG: hypothetical protein AAB365_01815 [Patescibacteria group bacterium]
MDLITLSQSIAQLNLGYLGISVAILGVLGGVFVYFNIRPLKETLEKQEKKIEELKKEAQGLLKQSLEQSSVTLEAFKKQQVELLSTRFKQQEQNIALETTNKIQDLEKILLITIDNVSETKDTKLREIILSKTNNLISEKEKDLIMQITNTRESVTKEISQTNTSIASLRAHFKQVHERVKELQVYKYSKEGKMGAVIFSTELLKDAIDDYFNLRKTTPSVDKNLGGWKIELRLDELLKEIGDNIMEGEYASEILAQLDRLMNEKIFADKIENIRKMCKLEKHPRL